jgi:hypothetical protein
MVLGYEGAMVPMSDTHHRSRLATQLHEAVMNFDHHDAAQPATDAVPHIAAPFSEAANDGDFYSNPLWMVAIALACLFALLACLVAS